LNRLDLPPMGCVQYWGCPVTTLQARDSTTRTALDSQGNVFFFPSDLSPALYKIHPDGSLDLVAGLPGSFGTADGFGTAAQFRNPTDLAIDDADNLYVLDVDTVRRITPDGTVTTFVGQPGVTGLSLGPLPGLLQAPTSLATAAGGVLYVSDRYGVLKVH